MSEEIQRYIPAYKLPNYKDFCPIVPIWGTLQEDNKFLGYTNGKQVEFDQSELLNNVGFLVLEIGDVNEDYTVSTAARAVFESLQALFSACHNDVRYERIRTAIELSEYLKVYRKNFSHIILIGHGGVKGIKFLDKGSSILGSEIAGLLGADSHKNEIQIISLCCHSGCNENANALSRAENVTEVLAPSKAFDIRWAVHFINGYFLNMYLLGKPIEKAVCDAALDKNSTPMTIWKKGEKVFECKSTSD